MPRRSREDRLFARYCRTGSPRALAALFDRTAPELARLARYLISDPHAADDLVQDTFLTAIEHGDRYDPDRPVVPWLLGVLANLARRRRRAARSSGELGDAIEAREDPTAVAERRELERALQREVRGLPQPYRDVLTLHLERGLGAHSIAEQRGCPPSTVRNQVMRGLDLLRRALPAGFAGGAAVASVSASAIAPNLVAVRAAVLERARAAPRLVAPGPALAGGGILVMKKTLISAAAALAVGLAVWAWIEPPGGGEPAPSEPRPVAAARSTSSPGTASAERPRDDVAREAVPAAAGSEGLGALAVELRFARDDRPAAGVGVYLRPRDAAVAPLELRTDAEGRVEFGGIPPGAFLVQPDRSDGLDVDVRAGARREVTVRIPRGIRVRGVVVDFDRAPVAGARVYTARLTHHDYRQLAATTDGEGRFELRDVAPGSTLVAWADGYQPSHPRHGGVGGPLDSTADLVLRLGARGHRLRGRVVDEAGQPVARAFLAVAVDEDSRKHPEGELAPKYPSEFERPMDLESMLLRCDEYGRFDSTSVPMGSTLLIARAADRDDPRVAVGAVIVRPHTDNEIELRLDAGAEIHGTVVDRDGLPYAGLPVLVEWLGSMALGNLEHHVGHLISDRTATTDAEGRFTLAGLLPGRHRIGIGAYFDDKLRIDEAFTLHREEVQLEARQTLPWHAVLERRVALAVRVLDAEGEPLQGWAVFAADEPTGTDARRLSRHVTDARGACRLTHVPRGPLIVSVHARLPSLGTFDPLPAHVLRDVRPGIEPIEVRVPKPPTGALHGRVAAPRASIELERDGWPRTRAAERPGTDGLFRFESLAPGSYRLRVQAAGFEPRTLGPFEVPAAAPLDAGEIALAPR